MHLLNTQEVVWLGQALSRFSTEYLKTEWDLIEDILV